MAMSLRTDDGGSGPFSDIGNVSTRTTNSIVMADVSTIPANVKPFDLSPIAGLSPNAKFQGNKVSDITSAYQSYLTNTAVGKGGQYAQDVVRKYGAADIRAGAASYLQAAGLSFLADIVQPSSATTSTTTSTTTTPTDTTTPVVSVPENPFQLLLDALPNLFGQQVYNPPLQSQTYGYTPQQTIDSGGSGGISIMPILILLGIGVIGYFLYKKYA
jgi:hypothetical protein